MAIVFGGFFLLFLFLYGPQVLQCLYLSHFKSDLHAIKSKVGLLIEYYNLVTCAAICAISKDIGTSVFGTRGYCWVLLEYLHAPLDWHWHKRSTLAQRCSCRILNITIVREDDCLLTLYVFPRVVGPPERLSHNWESIV